MKKITPKDGVVKDDVEYPLVKPGDYYAVYRSHGLFRMYGNAQKLRIWFTIIDGTDGFGLDIPLFCNVTITSWRNRSWTAGTRTKLVRMLCRLFPSYHPRKSKRVPVSMLAKRQCRIRIITVTKDRAGNPLPEQLHYSKVECVICLVCHSQEIQKKEKETLL